MVSVRVMVTLGAFVIFLSWGFAWVEAIRAQSYYTSFDLFGLVGSSVGTCHCPPSNDTMSGAAQLALLPYLIPPGMLSPGIILLPIATLVSFAAFARLKLTIWAGVLTIIDGAAWIVGCLLLPSQVGVQASYGPYVLLFGGGILIATALLDRADKLDLSEDLN